MDSRTNPLVSDGLTFPILVFKKRGILWLFSDWDHFTTGRREALARGGYSNLIVVDAAGMGFAVARAKKLRGKGIFGGWNILGGQLIKLEYVLSNKPEVIALSEVRKLLHGSFEERPATKERGDFEEMVAVIAEASSHRELLEKLKGHVALDSKWY